VLNPGIELRIAGRFTPVYEVMGVRQMAQLGLESHVRAAELIDRVLEWSRGLVG
jgi:hypothetical protein